MSNTEAEEFKKKGNEDFKEKRFDEAIKNYNKAITLDPNNASYYSNRSGAWSSKGNHESALKDATLCVEKDPTFVKGYSRKGKANFDMGKWDEAEAAYKEGLLVGPEDAGCKSGLAAIAGARSRKKAASSGKGMAGMAGMFGGINRGNFVQKIAEKMKSGGRIQMYLVFIVGYYLFKNVTGRGSKSSTSSSFSSHDVADDDDARGDVSLPTRGFAEVGGHWLSFMQTQEPKAEATLLLLHSTAASAEADYGAALPQLAEAGRPTVRLLAPDRPCHGYSPCPAGGEPVTTSWLKGVLAKKAGGASQLWLASTGRDAARQALALASAKKEATQLWLLSPRSEAPSAVPAALAASSDLRAWLAQQKGSAAAAADAARWAVAVGKGSKGPEQGSLNVADLPRGCKVTLLYGEDDEEDEETRAALEAEGVPYETKTAGEMGLLQMLADEVQTAAGPDTGAAHASVDDDDDV